MTEPEPCNESRDTGREKQAVQLRLCGHTYSEIAARLGYTDGEAVRSEVRAALARNLPSPTEMVKDGIRQTEELRLAMLRAHPQPSLSQARMVRDLEKTHRQYVTLLASLSADGDRSDDGK